jgi:hypothetical protein
MSVMLAPNIDPSILRPHAIVPMRGVSVERMPALVAAVARALRAEGAVLAEEPSPLFLGPPTDFSGPVRVDASELWLAYYFQEARQNKQFFYVSLRSPPTGPPGVDMAPPLEDTPSTRSTLDVVARALASCHERVFWCADGDEAFEVVRSWLDDAGGNPGG